MSIIMMFVLAYLIGSISPGLIIGKTFFNKDIRNYGSGNLGATNTFRVLGRQAGIVVTLLDMAKGVIGALLPILFHSDVHGILVGLFAVLGHVFSIFLKFKGGKAVATSAGVVLAVNPLLFIITAITFFSVLYAYKYVSLASIIASIINFIAAIAFSDWIVTVISFVIMVIVIVRHRSNINRIMNHEEPKIKWM
ncbi:glycerol-3-phosphate 1-O-acyltransferase [Macrococcus hajekii]|uniref:Glycerol-3-phosphate acyltransferase n=1 Tax=Macrococcus hajekii TaxID=198482 RepID=A0A4R6BMK9_9STAP|nr:glycerol-3-phosphate 1-O-acyltransferase PlsY [Macrococcus hajekii]TDM03074.1 glycerol-3-phosphate 1-O-acyltransferase [Macrococcus hajekii]GGB06346.1 glycerol-3-phosphate acyltransferase [Macrococcus hajekii]